MYILADVKKIIITVVRGKFHWDQATKPIERKASRKPDRCHTEWLKILERACLLVGWLVNWTNQGFVLHVPVFFKVSQHTAQCSDPDWSVAVKVSWIHIAEGCFEDLRRNEERQWCEVFARYYCKASCLSCPLLWLAQNQTQRKWLLD